MGLLFGIILNFFFCTNSLTHILIMIPGNNVMRKKRDMKDNSYKRHYSGITVRCLFMNLVRITSACFCVCDCGRFSLKWKCTIQNSALILVCFIIMFISAEWKTGKLWLQHAWDRKEGMDSAYCYCHDIFHPKQFYFSQLSFLLHRKAGV